MPGFRALTTQRLTFMILVALVFGMAVRVPLDTDTWWHLRAGEYIVSERTIPTSDPFSHTRANQPWIDHGWGAQIVLYATYALLGGGLEPGAAGNIGLALLCAALATAGMVAVYLNCSGNTYLRAFMVVLGAATAAVFWSPRPQMFSFALGALVLLLLQRFKREHVDRLWLIPVVMALWANLHGGFAIGFIFLFGSLAGEVLGNLLDPEDPRVVRGPRLKKQMLIMAAAILAVALNPHGVALLTYPWRTVNIGVLQDFIQEWASPNFHDRATWPFVVLLLGVLAAGSLSKLRMDWTDLVLVTGTAFMALTAGRNIAVFAVAATPVLSRHLDAWLTERGWTIRPRRSVSARMAALNWLLLILVLAGVLAKIGLALNKDTVARAQRDRFPVELASYLRTNPPPGLMFNSYNWGGYLMFAAPDVPVYVDGRTDLYDDAFLRHYLGIVFVREGWSEALDTQNIGYVAIESGSMLAVLLRTQPERWTEQQFDEGRSALFVRTAPAQG